MFEPASPDFTGTIVFIVVAAVGAVALWIWSRGVDDR